MSHSIYENYGQDEYLDFNAENFREQPTNFAGVGPKGYVRTDDRITEDICEVLMKDKFIDASEIEVSVKDGIVFLFGTVDSRSEKFCTEIAIEGIAGVKDILNELKVKKWGDYSVRTYQKNFDNISRSTKEDHYT
jgi:hypothetical protein